ncbi:uncharacterized protein LOC105182165 [Harpegnathos saltator]|uniref:uncharacterized protein LOC105182165 n=1 Tax=Harpegnathos saltator TaxID=610380 RepID=UPI000591731D|nr:uncharacterized protein LOC105182165 [Harpegnathos saltator]XP_025158540.1 uncharacterized protein LOC105182165 [Harpegnathos saltator]XP_025158541.1 uncharacterized protein LOC105182165 [Harpegnathos saltator]
MRRSDAIGLFALCVLVLLAGDSSAISHFLRKYLPTLLRSPWKELSTLRHGIVPGTLWCGPGHIANNYSELGSNWQLDECCRAHDFCTDYIRPQQSKYGLYNSAKLCRSSLCDCDLQFYNCVKKAPGFIAFSVGKIYFKNCKFCFRRFDDADTCMEKGLTVSEGTSRDGHRAFCAQFDRNPKWGHRRHLESSESIPAATLPTWIDSEPVQTIPESYPVDDNQSAEEDEDDETSQDIDLSMLNVS